MLNVLLIIAILFSPSISASTESSSLADIENIQVHKTRQDNVKDENKTSIYIGITKDIFHILFFITMIVVAILTFFEARKTVFSPIKTEIFKRQLMVFEDVISHFQYKSKIELVEDMDMNNIIDINSFHLLHSYIKTFFSEEMHIEQEEVDEQRKRSYGALTTADFIRNGLSDGSESVGDIPCEPSLKLASWNNKAHELTHYTKIYHDAITEIKSFQNSPLLPEGLKKLLNEYHEMMHESLVVVTDSINEASKLMTTKYQTASSLDSFSTSWISNIANSKRPDLESKANEILGYINSHLGVDNLTQKNV